MAAVKTASALLLLAITSSGSTCHGQSGGTEAAGKEPQATAAVADVNLPGIDTSSLTPLEKREFNGYVSEFLAPCADIPVSIAQCVQEKRACPRCTPAARFIFKGVRDGMAREQVEEAYKNRFQTDRVKNVPLDGSPTRGLEGAPVTVIEFADFECPFCGVMAPRLEKIATERSRDVRMVYKFMPLPAHPHGEIAARAAFAAWNQGKFWEMNKKLFDNQKHLEQSDLDGYAKDLGLDLPKFRTDMQSPAATARLEQDRKLADGLGVKGTPTIYINGRNADPAQDLNEWISFELGLQDSAKSDSGSASPPPPSAAPSGGAATDAAKGRSSNAAPAPKSAKK